MTTAQPAKPGARHPLENRIPPPLVVVFIGAVMFGIAWPTPAVAIASAPRLAAGGILLALGAGLVVLGANAFWKAGTTTDPVKLQRASTLVTDGAFHYTRNPMYVGFATILSGWAVCLAAPARCSDRQPSCSSPPGSRSSPRSR